MDTTMNITNADLRPDLRGARRPPLPIRPALLPHALFVAELLARGLGHVARDNFPGGSAPAALSRLGTPLLVRSDAKQNEVEALLRMRGGEIALIDAGHGHVWVEAAADAEKFEQISGNYSAPVRAALERLIASGAPERGRLILWRGEPGTGKWHALRALARSWTPWCSAHFIIRRCRGC